MIKMRGQSKMRFARIGLQAKGGIDCCFTVAIIDALVLAGLCKTKGEARRMITQGGAYVNNRRVAGVETRLTPAALASESTVVLRAGKKNYALLRFG